MRHSWHRFCDELKEAGDLVFRDTAPRQEVDRAKGLRLLARNIALGLQFKLENIDPRHPELMHYFDPVRKQGGDNCDALYVGAPIDGSNLYRLVGKRGSARYFAITVLENGNTPWGGAVTASLFGQDIDVAADGSFEVLIGPPQMAPSSGNFIATTDASWRLTIRQFFADWENEEPMIARIDCLSATGPKPELTAQGLSQGLADTAAWVAQSSRYWVDMLDKWRACPNTFASYRELADNAIDATPGGEPLICYWRVPRDEALIITVVPPEADYWAVEFGNYWWETMDYRYRHCSTNCHQASLQADGELILVVCHEDPGVANWLDPSGHEEGYLTVRWIGAEHYPTPQCRQIKMTELGAVLPASMATVTPQQRREELAARRRGIMRRFR